MAKSKKENAEDNVEIPRLEPRKIYLKDVSFESPLAPNVFLSEEEAPQLDIQLTLQHKHLENMENYYEVVLNVTITAARKEATLFLAELQQAGVFEISNVKESDLLAVLEIACPNILLPFAREEIASLVGKGGFPQLLLNPVNFEVLYAQKREKEVKGADKKIKQVQHH